MEILAVAGLAYVGKKLSEKPIRSENQGVALHTKHPMFTESSNDSSGVIVPETEGPLLSGSQTNFIAPDYLSDRKLESYTGGLSKLSRKNEVGALFAPTQDVYTNVIPSQEAARRFEDIPVEKTVFNNTSPIPQVQVGPGLGLGYFDTVRDSGFHETFRILPGNVNGYRRNTEMASKVIPGKSINEEMQSRIDYRAPKNDLTQEYEFMDPIGGVYQVKQPTVFGEVDTNRHIDKRHVAYAGGGHGMDRETGERGHYTPSRNHAPVGYSGAATGKGDQAYTNSAYLTYPNQRSDSDAFPILGGFVPTKGEVQNNSQDTRYTQRGAKEDMQMLGGYSSNTKTTTRDIEFDIDTHRDNDAVILSGKGTNTKYMSPAVQVYGTQRDTLHQTYSGIAGKTMNGQYENLNGTFDALNTNKPVASNTPNPGRVNVIAHGQFGSVQAKTMENAQRAPTFAKSSTAHVDPQSLGFVEQRIPMGEDTYLQDHIYAANKLGAKDLNQDISRMPEFR